MKILHRLFRWLFIISGSLLLLGGCDKSANNSITPEAPYGLEQRPVMATLNLPTTTPSGVVNLVEAFPSLPAFASPVYLTNAGDGSDRLFVVELGGVIKVFDNDDTASNTSVFLDISGKVTSGGETGLLGLAFDPDYKTNGTFYVYYTAPGPVSTLSRFQVSGTDPNQADAASETILLQQSQPYANHNGGTIAFGPDGMLYWGLGDGGSGGDPHGNAQNTKTLLGSMLRIDVHNGSPYAIPPDNPFASASDGTRREIWAYGLRNPYRFSFDRNTGRLWVADVGQNLIEEIDVVEKGGNYGWNWYEGNGVYTSGAPTGNFQFPIFQYDHSVGSSITGGFVYRGSRVPALRGKYVYGDFVASKLWVLTVDDNLHVLDNQSLGTAPQNVSAFGEDEAGELYVVGYGGKIYTFEAGAGFDQLTGFPAKLSETGLFAELSTLTPASGLIQYNVVTQLWSDYAQKRRWIAIPDSKRIRFSADGNWQFPVGTLLVKHFDMDMVEGDPDSARRLETRVLIQQTGGWVGASYRWNVTQTDADLLTASATESLDIADANFPNNLRSQTYFYPGPGDCLTCHTYVAGRVLGVRTRQLNSAFDFNGVEDIQLRSWNHIGLFTTDIGDTSSYPHNVALDDVNASLEQRSRSYLATNCSFCHISGGPTPTTINLAANISLADMNAIDIDPTAGDLGITNAKIIAPGDHARSILWQRMNLTDSNRMPPLGSNMTDPAALDVIRQWIDGL